ncbi:MAG: hypothetical protein GF419_04350 [Ignavibacteriales bacterium]|nr:hypothetical protein [Ignavibacteriales bacterium]
MLALTDPIAVAAMILAKTFGATISIHPYHALVPLFFLSFYFQEELKNKALRGGIFLTALVGSYVVFGASQHILMVINLLIVAELLKRAFIWVNTRNEINLFHFVFILYIISGLIKLGYIGSTLAESPIVFTVATTYQLLVAVFYSYYQEEEPRLAIKLPQPSETEEENL